MSDDMELFDEVVQMQLAEFQRHILGATGAEMCVIVIETNGVVQCATGSKTMTEIEGRARSASLMAQIGASMIDNGSAGQFELVVRDKSTGDVFPAGENIQTVVVKV